MANIQPGEGFNVYIEKNRRAILLVRVSEINTQDRMQAFFKALKADKLLTPDQATFLVTRAKKVESEAYADIARSIKPKPKIKRLGKKSRTR